MNPYDPYNPHQQWILKDHHLVVNRLNHDEVLDISNKDDEDMAQLCAWEYNGGDNQQWTAVYLHDF